MVGSPLSGTARIRIRVMLRIAGRAIGTVVDVVRVQSGGLYVFDASTGHPSRIRWGAKNGWASDSSGSDHRGAFVRIPTTREVAQCREEGGSSSLIRGHWCGRICGADATRRTDRHGTGQDPSHARDAYDDTVTQPHTHCWIDPTDAPIACALYAPIIGPGRYHMKPGRMYRCRDCGATVVPLE